MQEATHPPKLAKTLTPSALIDTLKSSVHPHSSHPKVPLIIHQTWSTSFPPSSYDNLINSWKKVYPEATYVLWNDTDNRRLVEEVYPELKESYEALPREIYRGSFQTLALLPFLCRTHSNISLLSDG